MVGSKGKAAWGIRIIGSIFRYQQEWLSVSTFYPAPEKGQGQE
jgi:hypothetical protein